MMISFAASKQFYFILSLLTHFIIVGFLVMITYLLDFMIVDFMIVPIKKNDHNMIVVDLINQEKPIDQKKQKLFVKNLEIPDNIKKMNNEMDMASFVSKDTVRVTQQMRASKIGPTQNKLLSMKPLSQNLSKDRDRHIYEKQLDSAQKSQMDVSVNYDQWLKALPPLDSSIGLALPESIEIGEFTALNTDRFTFYTFFERVENAIRYPWEKAVRQGLRSLTEDKKNHWAKPYATTIIEVLLNSNGEIKDILLLKSSGLHILDQACANAFWAARVFKNPPQDLIEEDGLIHLRYKFTVFFR